MGLIEYDITNSFPRSCDLDFELVKALETRLVGDVETLIADRESGALPYLDLPEQSIERCIEQADSARSRFDRLVVLGIGGSSLGARAIIEALWEGASEKPALRPNVDFNENVDVNAFSRLLRSVDWETTQWNVVTKSGSTIETLSAFFVVLEELERRFGPKGARERIIVTTDPTAGPLRSMAKQRDWTTLDVPPGVGGRFSVLSPVGLYPVAFSGIDVKELLAGAGLARKRCLSTNVLGNPAAVLASLQVLNYQAGRNIVVFMPYAADLSSFAEWFGQIWAESLGKRRGDECVGPTPVLALGVRDQHSQLQLFMEGPRDKNILFVEVSDFRENITVPMIKDAPSAVAHVCGKGMSEIMRAELAGTRQALYEEGCPTSTIRLQTITPEAVGALLMLLEMSTSLAGALFAVDPYNQPGVELGKRYAHGLLGRAKESHYAVSLAEAESARTKRVLTI